MKIFFIIGMAVLIAGLSGPANAAGGQQKREIVGTAEAVKEAGMVFWRLVDRAGQKIDLPGAPYEFEGDNPMAASCIEQSVDKGGQIRLTGVWKKDGEATLCWMLPPRFASRSGAERIVLKRLLAKQP